MKVKVINRSEKSVTRERSEDVRQVHRNLDPILHPFEKAREYTRALNAAKLERVFAKPFIAALPHDEAVYSLARNPARLDTVLAGCGDGVVCLWDVPEQRCLRRLVGHTRIVHGVAIAPSGRLAVSASADSTLRLWALPAPSGEPRADPLAAPPVATPAAELTGRAAFLGVDHHPTRETFASCGGGAVELWDTHRTEALQRFVWDSETVHAVRFNPADPDLFVSAGSDRGVALFDLRARAPLRKVVMQTASNAVAWNPMEPLNFVAANEDCNLYSYDLRKLDAATCVHEDFTSAVMDVDFSPTGKEFVAGSYDRSVRIFRAAGGHSREVYTAKRMQRVFATRFTGDGTYVVTGSDDFNLRVWKAIAHEHLGTLLPRERHKHAYEEALKARFRHLPEVNRILRHRHLPAVIYKATKTRRIQKDSEKRKERNRIAHSTPGSVIVKPARKKKIVAQVE